MKYVFIWWQRLLKGVSKLEYLNIWVTRQMYLKELIFRWDCLEFFWIESSLKSPQTGTKFIHYLPSEEHTVSVGSLPPPFSPFLLLLPLPWLWWWQSLFHYCSTQWEFPSSNPLCVMNGNNTSLCFNLLLKNIHCLTQLDEFVLYSVVHVAMCL